MDKNEESIFTSHFWREINEQYFIVQSPVQLTDIETLNSKSRNRQKSKCLTLLNKLIRQNNRTKLFQTNLNNLKTRVQLLFLERQLQQEPIQNLMDEMIDQICNDHLKAGLNEAQDIIKNISHCQEQQQLQIYYKEAKLLSNLMYQVDWPDELSISIEQYQQQLNELTINNKVEFQNLQQYVNQINLTVLYTYNSQQIGEQKLKLTRKRMVNHSNELDLLKNLIISLQNYQVAESIGKATFNDYNNTITVIFDKYLSQNPVTLSLEEFDNLQRLRDSPYDLGLQSSQLRSNDVFDMQMCHYCKQMVEIKNLKQCQYNHYSLGLHEYNEDLLVCQRYKINTKQTQQYFLDLYSENYIIEDQQIMCQRYFCLQCLKYDFDSYETTSYLWICPLCKGLCTCNRCQRNDMIYKIKRQFLELNGDLEEIYQQSQFEILTKAKRKQLQTIPLEFLKIPKLDLQENVRQNQDKSQIQLNIIKKKIKKDDSIIIKKCHKLYQLESSSSSIKIKRSKETTQNIIMSLDSINSQVYVQ